MMPGLRSALVTLAFAFLAGLGGVWLGKTVFDTGLSHQSLHERIHAELNLGATQQTQIASLERDYSVRRQALELEMRSANAELAAAIREEHGYGPRVTAAVERFHQSMGRLQTETLRHVFAMREVLTPAQKTRFDDIVTQALTAEPP